MPLFTSQMLASLQFQRLVFHFGVLGSANTALFIFFYSHLSGGSTSEGFKLVWGNCWGAVWQGGMGKVRLLTSQTELHSSG